MPKPMLLTSVSTLPTACGGAFTAVSAENCGESPATVMPHSSSHSPNSRSGACSSQGATAQHRPLQPSCQAATRALPTRRAQAPPAMQPMAPAPSTAKAAQDSAAPCSRVARIIGTSTHIVYSSHMWPK